MNIPLLHPDQDGKDRPYALVIDASRPIPRRGLTEDETAHWKNRILEISPDTKVKVVRTGIREIEVEPMTPAQIVLCEMTQKGLDDPTRLGMIISGWNPFTRSYTYRYEDFVIWYEPHSHNTGVWVARNPTLGLRLEFDRDEPIALMVATMADTPEEGGV